MQLSVNRSDHGLAAAYLQILNTKVVIPPGDKVLSCLLCVINFGKKLQRQNLAKFFMGKVHKDCMLDKTGI